MKIEGNLQGCRSLLPLKRSVSISEPDRDPRSAADDDVQLPIVVQVGEGERLDQTISADSDSRNKPKRSVSIAEKDSNVAVAASAAPDHVGDAVSVEVTEGCD